MQEHERECSVCVGIYSCVKLLENREISRHYWRPLDINGNQGTDSETSIIFAIVPLTILTSLSLVATIILMLSKR